MNWFDVAALVAMAAWIAFNLWSTRKPWARGFSVWCAYAGWFVGMTCAVVMSHFGLLVKF